jgi:FkbM family methyltransferase
MDTPRLTLPAAMGLLRSLAVYFNPLRTRSLRRFYRDLLRPGDLVFDVGAHVGTRARAMHACGACVIAFEPQPVFARFLRRTLPQGIVLEETALGPEERLAEMAVSSLHPTVSSLRMALTQEAAAMPGFEHVRWDGRADVRMTSLDRMIARHGVPRYIKIDVEGFETEVMSGLSQPVDLISFEYLPGLPQVSREVVARIDRLGPCEFNAVRGESGRFDWPEWRPAAEVDAWLAGLSPNSGSGDLYARRKPV